MKKILFLVVPVVLLLLSGCSASRTARTDAVEVADSVNKSRSGEAGYDKTSAGFLVDAADARMMDIKEGRAAVKQGQSAEVRNYGRQMVKEQTALLNRIRKIAANRHIALPADISNTKKEQFSQLAELKQTDFDEKFTRMMIADHQRDVGEFKQAQSLSNAEVAAFATSNLPLIQRQLDKIQAIQDRMKK